MKQMTISILLGILVIACGCRSSEQSKNVEARISDTSRATTGSKPPRAVAVAQNVTRVEAVIERVTLIDNIQFDMGIFIVKSEPVSGKLSIIEPQQRVTVYPEFRIAGPAGGIDTADVRNKKLLSLRTAQIGTSFKGKISVDQYGVWKLLEVEDH